MTPRHGRVVTFDPHRGLGTVEADDGERFGFHCVRITDDTRDIPVGAAVQFTVVPGQLGAWEAAAITRAP
jgi:cold shock CspA family protein